LPIAGLISKTGSDVSDALRQVLSTMRHHPQAATSLAVGNRLTRNGEEHVVSSLPIGRDKALGSCGFSGAVDSPVQPIHSVGGKFLLAAEGQLRGVACAAPALSEPLSAWSSVYDATFLFDDAVTANDDADVVRLSGAMTRLRGSFALGLLDGRRITVARDVLGVEPLYWGENERYAGFASERKALWSLGVTAVTAVPPGHVAVITSKARRLRRVGALQRPPIVDISLGDAAQALKALLHRIVKMSLVGVGAVGVFFSGGVDSALVAKSVIDHGVTPVLYAAGFEGSHDVEVARQAADELNCPLHEAVLSFGEAEHYVRKVIYAVESEDFLTVSIGLPLYVAAEAAEKDGVGRVFAGQGADELFGGYARYSRVLQQEGAAALADALWADVVHLADRNLQRDKGVALATNIDLVLPFVDLEVIHLASSFPPHLKVASSQDTLRKPVLRAAARLFGLSENITRRPKKAMQYGSGAHKAIHRLAARSSYRRPRDYVASLFREVFPDSLG
jgi:asparagine synthetase B (glutamine-hydrolysing)